MEVESMNVRFEEKENSDSMLTRGIATEGKQSLNFEVRDSVLIVSEKFGEKFVENLIHELLHNAYIRIIYDDVQFFRLSDISALMSMRRERKDRLA